MPSREWLSETYWQGNNSAQDIANIQRVSLPTVHRWLDLYGIPKRSISEAALLTASRRTYAEQLRITAASRAIITGKKRSHEDLCKRARGKQRTARMSTFERELFSELTERGFVPVPLLAVDKYNIDLGFPEEKIGIEVDGGNWHKTAKRKKAQDTKKARLLARLGWKVLRVSTRRKEWIPFALPSILAILSPR